MAQDLTPDTVLRSLFLAAVDAAQPAKLITPEILPAPPRGRTIVVGCGKAAGAMAQAFEAAWPYPCEGVVVTQYGYRVPTRAIEVMEAGHPVPDEASVTAARRILDTVRLAGAHDQVIALIAGGGSALMCLPAPGLTLADKQDISRALLASGAPISEMNRVRRAMSAIKGGRLAAAAGPAACVSYIISDVPGDDPAVIGGGPMLRTVEDGSRALAVLARYGVAVEDRIRQAILANPAPPPPAGRQKINMIATPGLALAAAVRKAEDLGFAVENLGDAVEGEAREVAGGMAARTRAVRDRPRVLISGGETTVTIRGRGRGGRNGEFLLALALALDGANGIYALACDTDGFDGGGDNAGAVIGPDILDRARALGLDARAMLDDNDSYGFFTATGGLVTTGPTYTNVNDFRAILVT
ncbi:MAG: glycerate kinase [Alphaproteobacteria bacterium]|nr:glycerate kinase [Alphaproteobacteria bacterium]